MRSELVLVIFGVLLAYVWAFPTENGESVQESAHLLDVDGQGHENESQRKVRQFGFGYPDYGGYGGYGDYGGYGGDGGYGGYGDYGGYGGYGHGHHHHHHHGHHGG